MALEYSFDLTYLYMQASQDNLSYAISSDQNQLSAPPLNGEVLIPEFMWQNAIAASASVYDFLETMGMQINWTHYISHNSTNSSAPAGGILFPTTSIVPNSLSGPISSTFAQSTWSLDFDIVNLLYFSDFGTSFILPTYLNVGIQLNWIRESFDNQYNNSTNLLGEKNITQSNQSTDSWGLGPIIGLKLFYYFYEGFHVFSKTFGALSFCQNKSKNKLTNSDIASDIGRPNQSIFFIKEKRRFLLNPNSELGLGFGWTSLVDQHEVRLYFSAEYDLIIWFNQNQFLNFLDGVNRGKFSSGGNLYIHGLAAKASVIF